MEGCQLEEFRVFTDEVFQKSNELTDEFSTFIDEVFLKSNGLTDDFSKFIDAVFKDNKKLFSERDEIKRAYNFGGYDDFNILTVTNFGWGETAHSEVLCKILDPNTPVISNRKNLESFFRLIGLTEEEISKWDFTTVGVMTEGTENKLYDWFALDNSSENIGKEKGRIDILIADGKKNCVIIENKLKNAPNMPNQLERYVQIVERHGLKIHKIVYMPPTKYKTPDACDKEYEKENKEIRENNWLVTIPAVRRADEKNVKSLVQDYFPNLMKEKLSETNKIKLVFFDQYKKLIAKLGEDEVMKNIEKEIVKLLCGTPENQKRTNDLIELVNSKNFGTLKLELVCEQIGGLNYEPEPFKGWNVYAAKLKYAKNTNSDIYFYVGQTDFGMGIKSATDNKELLSDLEKRIKSNVPDGNKYRFGPDGEWWWGFRYFEDIGKNFGQTSITELVDIIKKAFDEIQQALLK